MHLEQDVIVDAVLAGMVGRTAKVRKYDRTLNTPINFLLNHIQKELPKPFSMYWVEGGLPEVFCLSGFASTPIVCNARYIEMVYLMRRLLADGPLSGFTEELAERTCLRIMAELAIRYKSPDWAVRAFIKSILNQGVQIVDIPGVALLDLESQPINEAYVATWFFGLAHELGHLYAEGRDLYAIRMVSPDAAGEALEVAIEKFLLPPGVKEEVLAQAANGPADYILSPRRLASEALADTFAMHTLFNVARLIMAKVGREKFELAQFISEMTLVWALIGILERCKRVALIADDLAVGQHQKEEILLQPISYGVRALLTRRMLDFDIVTYLYGPDRPTEEQWRKTESAVNDITQGWQEKIDQVESGLARAMRFALFPDERPSNLMTLLATEIIHATPGQRTVEINQFCDLGESFHPGNESIQALRRGMARLSVESSGSRVTHSTTPSCV